MQAKEAQNRRQAASRYACSGQGGPALSGVRGSRARTRHTQLAGADQLRNRSHSIYRLSHLVIHERVHYQWPSAAQCVLGRRGARGPCPHSCMPALHSYLCSRVGGGEEQQGALPRTPDGEIHLVASYNDSQASLLKVQICGRMFLRALQANSQAL